ncbi:MAG: hypothetical protein JO151_16170 [Verrucomicrobia bacterium]|nr:hypothetical protein [Verrucomicrobiota bacterium]
MPEGWLQAPTADVTSPGPARDVLGAPKVVTGAEAADAMARLGYNVENMTSMLPVMNQITQSTTSLVDNAYSHALNYRKSLADLDEANARTGYYDAQAANIASESDQRKQLLPLDVQAKKLALKSSQLNLDAVEGQQADTNDALDRAREAITALPAWDDPQYSTKINDWLDKNASLLSRPDAVGKQLQTAYGLVDGRVKATSDFQGKLGQAKELNSLQQGGYLQSPIDPDRLAFSGQAEPTLVQGRIAKNLDQLQQLIADPRLPAAQQAQLTSLYSYGKGFLGSNTGATDVMANKAHELFNANGNFNATTQGLLNGINATLGRETKPTEVEATIPIPGLPNIKPGEAPTMRVKGTPEQVQATLTPYEQQQQRQAMLEQFRKSGIPDTPENRADQAAYQRGEFGPPQSDAAIGELSRRVNARAAAAVQAQQGGTKQVPPNRRGIPLSEPAELRPTPAEPELAAPGAADPEPVAAEPGPVRPTPPAEEPPQPAPKREGFVEPPPTEPTRPVPLEPGERANIEQRLYDAYQTLSAERQRTSLPIGDVVERVGVPLDQAKSAIIGLRDKVQLDQGDWPSATDAQRAAAIHAAGRPRLYMAFTEPPGAAAPPTPVALADQNRILSAYDTLRAQGQPQSVAISDLQRQSGLPLSVVQAWLARNQNAIALHEGDWANASTNNRNAALNVNGRKNLLADLSALSRATGAPGQLLARLPGPRTAEVRFPTEPVKQLSQREVKRTVNASASHAGLDGKVSYVPTEQSLPRRVRLAIARQGYEPGSAQTVWDRTLRQLWVIGDAFSNADELHRALIEETVPRAFDGLRFSIATVHDESDPRLGWWDPASEQATLSTAALIARPQPLVDASKTAVHEAVVHGGFSQLFANTREGRDTWVAAMHAARNYFDSTGISQRLARARGFSGIEDMTQA